VYEIIYKPCIIIKKNVFKQVWIFFLLESIDIYTDLRTQKRLRAVILYFLTVKDISYFTFKSKEICDKTL